MKYLTVVIVLILNTLSEKNCERKYASKTVHTLSGHVQQRSLYCGGARPTQQMIDSLTKLVPYPNKSFYVKKGTTNSIEEKVIESFTTDQRGYFSIELPAGTYAIILEEQLKEIDPKKYQTAHQKVDIQCLLAWWQKPYAVVEVGNQSTDSLQFLFTHRCFLKTDIPCITYDGPLPH
jgi:hypothetical protein